jgi:hypothetical protein
LTADERLIDVPSVADLADELVLFFPHQQGALPSAVTQAVGGRLVDREHKVGTTSGIESEAARALGHEATDRGQRLREDELLGLTSRLGERAL